jgi:hypothetical protein
VTNYQCPVHGVPFIAPGSEGFYFDSSHARDADHWRQFVSQIEAHRAAMMCTAAFEVL